MKTVLICPGDRPAVSVLADEAPLALVPALGPSLLEYWMSHLAGNGVKQVLLLASDRPEEVRKFAGTGTRWGISAEVIAEPQELTPQEASKKYDATATLIEHFPGVPEHPLFSSYRGWFDALRVWTLRAKTSDRVGAREVSAGIWVGLHCHISRDARLTAPCWVGDHVYVGPGAVIGPGTVLEDGAFIERDAEIISSIIGTATFVGRYVQIRNALAFGDLLVNWQTGVANRVSDAFLLCSVRLRHPAAKRSSLFDSLVEFFAPFKESPPVESQALLLKKGTCPEFAPIRRTQSS